jgi:hypothetical protein
MFLSAVASSLLFCVLHIITAPKLRIFLECVIAHHCVSCGKWLYCRSHVASSFVPHVGITDLGKLKKKREFSVASCGITSIPNFI